MNTNSGSQQNDFSYKNKINKNDDLDISDLNESDLLIFLQFYFTNAYKNLCKILSDKTILNESEIHKITSSFNFWLNFSLNFKDKSFVNLLLYKNDARVEFCKKKLIEILNIIVKFLYDNLNSEEAFNKMLKNNYNKLYELILKLKDIIDNVYHSDLRNEIFININEDEIIFKEQNNKNDSNKDKEMPASCLEPKIIEDKDEELKVPKIEINLKEEINDNNNNIKSINFQNSNDNNYINKFNIIKNNIDNDLNDNKTIPHNIEKNGNIIIEQKDENINNFKIINNNNDSNIINSQEIVSNKNIFPLKVNSPCLDYYEINKLFYNFCYFTNFNLSYFQIVFFEKIGYAFITYNGDFVWADDYTSYVLFEEENIKKINLFDIMTDFSKYILKKKYRDHFFDFKDENNRLRVFTYTIDYAKNKEQENKKKGEKLFEDLSKIKTLVSRASPVLLNIQKETYYACIFLETKFSLYRQNFDFFYWKNDWNNK